MKPIRLAHSAFAFAASVSLCLPANALADEWLPIAELSIPADVAEAGAFLEIERIELSDRPLGVGKGEMKVFRRIRVLSPGGIASGDVTLDFPEMMPIKDIEARTVLADGRILPLAKRDIHESTVLKAGGLRLRRLAFSMPGVAAGTTIDYRYRQVRPVPGFDWVFQQDLYLARGELRWEPLHVTGYRSWLTMAILSGGSTPRHTWLNCDVPGRVTPLPSADEAKEFVFEVNDVPPFQSEPFAMPEETVASQVSCRYGSPGGAKEFWAFFCTGVTAAIQRGRDGDDSARKIAARPREPGVEAFKWASEWVRDSLRVETDPSERDEEEDFGSVRGVFKNRKGTELELVLAMHALTKAAGTNCQIVFAKDHRKGRFDPESAVAQFDKFLLRAGPFIGSGGYCAPGERFLELGRIPWYVEGTPALVIGDGMWRFEVLPQSSPESNATQVELGLRLGDGGSAEGSASVRFWGHRAQELRLELEGEPADSREAKLRELLAHDIPAARFDSVEVTDASVANGPVAIRARVSVDLPLCGDSNDCPLAPFQILDTSPNPFTAKERRHPVSMDYAFAKLERVVIELPEDWTLGDVAPPKEFSNVIGSVKVTSEIQGSVAVSSRSFVLKTGFWPETQYQEGRDVFQNYEATGSYSYLVRRSSP